MSGHSKWAQIKHKKAVLDARRGKAFTKLLKEITVAARLGGGDPDGNPRLRAAILEAKGSNVPNDNINRAVKKGTGELAGEAYEEVTYEGYAPGGVAVLVAALTDNRNRTVSELRHLFVKHGGNLAESGAVAWGFRKRGYFAIERRALDEEAAMELALELQAEDVESDEDGYEIYTAADEFARVREELERRGVPLVAHELAMVPQAWVRVPEPRAAQILRLLEALEDHDDVQRVWSNLAIEPRVLAGGAGGGS
jgi:YebC/PmpR family DNA-binding regulatory protein